MLVRFGLHWGFPDVSYLACFKMAGLTPPTVEVLGRSQGVILRVPTDPHGCVRILPRLLTFHIYIAEVIEMPVLID